MTCTGAYPGFEKGGCLRTVVRARFFFATSPTNCACVSSTWLFRAKRGYNRILLNFPWTWWCSLAGSAPSREGADPARLVVVVVDDVDSRCRIGEMAARIMTKLGTVALQVGASFSSES